MTVELRFTDVTPTVVFGGVTAIGPAGSPGLVYRGLWSNVTHYIPKDVAYYNGSGYVALVEDTGTTPGTDPSVWDIIVQGSATSVYYQLFKNEGTTLPQQIILDFIGDGVTAADGSGKTTVTVPGLDRYEAAGAVATEATARAAGDATNASAVTAEATARANADTAEATARANADTAEATARNTAISTAINNLIASAPGTLDTLNELAAALGNDPNFAATITTTLAGKQPLNAQLTALALLTTTAYGRHFLELADTPAMKTLLAYVKGDVGLGNVDNTSDVNKPVSTAQATADALALAKASNLSDLANAGTARTNLGLGGAAVLNIGTTTGTASAGDDSRFAFVAVLQRQSLK